ncbi:hypothetical protein ZOSMA_22G00790 [Zostera marina]|uniref:Uncharacterized protein n=1 Tax=Zostera marina TaxID=29655 RepID=A0A0K9PKM3_ZOSMR|nr:hypothetical protein ZOSMA_22G00790 [Zostera marina]
MENVNGNSKFRGNPQFLYPGLSFSNNLQTNDSETNQNVPEQYQCANSESNIIYKYPSWIDELLDDSENPKEPQRRSSKDSFYYMRPYNIKYPRLGKQAYESLMPQYSWQFTQDAYDYYYYYYYMNARNYNEAQSCAINEAPTNIGMHQSHSSPYGNEFMKCTQDTSGDYYYINGRDYKGVQNCAINEAPTNIGMHQSHSSPYCNEFTCTKDAHANYHYMNARNYKGKEICVTEAPTNIGIHQIHPSQDGVKVSSHGRFSLGSTSRSYAAISTYIERQDEDFTPLNGCSYQTRVKPQFAQRSHVQNLIYIAELKRNVEALQFLL